MWCKKCESQDLPYITIGEIKCLGISRQQGYGKNILSLVTVAGMCFLTRDGSRFLYLTRRFNIIRTLTIQTEYFLEGSSGQPLVNYFLWNLPSYRAAVGSLYSLASEGIISAEHEQPSERVFYASLLICFSPRDS